MPGNGVQPAVWFIWLRNTVVVIKSKSRHILYWNATLVIVNNHLLNRFSPREHLPFAFLSLSFSSLTSSSMASTSRGDFPMMLNPFHTYTSSNPGSARRPPCRSRRSTLVMANFSCGRLFPQMRCFREGIDLERYLVVLILSKLVIINYTQYLL